MLLTATSATAASLTDNGDGTVSDADTGIVWQQGDDGMTRTWQDALSYCEGLSLAGHADWRLPDIRELGSITYDLQYSPAIDTAYFPNAYSELYWSATPFSGYAPYAWYVNFDTGSIDYYLKTYNGCVRCVR